VESPAWLARTVTVPAPVIVTVLPPVIVAGPLEMEKATVSPLEAVAFTVNDASP